jgi:hypothetical protein
VVRHGTFVAPTLIELESFDELKKEVFGPVLHVVRYNRNELDKLVDYRANHIAVDVQVADFRAAGDLSDGFVDTGMHAEGQTVAVESRYVRGANAYRTRELRRTEKRGLWPGSARGAL